MDLWTILAVVATTGWVLTLYVAWRFRRIADQALAHAQQALDGWTVALARSEKLIAILTAMTQAVSTGDPDQIH